MQLEFQSTCGTAMEYSKSPSTLSLSSAGALQKLKDRARSVDRFLSESRLNILGQSRETHKECTPPIEKSQSFHSGKAGKDPLDQENVPVSKTRHSGGRSGRKPRRDGSLSTGDADAQKSSSRWRSPSISRSLQANFQSLVSFLFERKHDARKRALAEQLLWTALRRQETVLFVDILGQLQDPPLDLNRPNQFGWRLVDEAVMLNYPAIANELFQRGAKESPSLTNKNSRMEALTRALRGLDAIRASSQLRPNPHPRLLAAELAAIPSINILQQMIHNVEKTRAPRNYLDKVTVEAWDEEAVAVMFLPRTCSPGIISRFKVEWCHDGTFVQDITSQTFVDVMEPCRLLVSNLAKDQPYFFRLSVGNLAGFGAPLPAQPTPLYITSWRDLTNHARGVNYAEALIEMQEILNRTVDLERQIQREPIINDQLCNEPSLRSVARRPSIKDSLKAIIKPPSRSFSSFDGGLFLSSVVIRNESILLCSDLSLPCVLVQNQFLSTVTAKEYARLHKLSCLQPEFLDTIRCLLSSSKDTSGDLCLSLTQAFISLQSWLCLSYLGLPYLHPLYDQVNNITLMLLVRSLGETDNFSVPSGLRWVHIKEIEALSLNQELDSILAMITSVGIAEMANFAKTATRQIAGGLHLSFLELQCTLDTVAVHTTKGRLNMLPTVKLRDNPHVSRDEWQSLASLSTTEDSQKTSVLSQQVTTAWQSLRRLLSLRPDEHHNPYLLEAVVRLDDQTASLILYCDQGGLKPQATLEEHRKGLLQIAVHLLESLFFQTHHAELWQTYCQAALLQESLAVHLLQRKRQVYSETVMSGVSANSKDQQQQFSHLQARLDKVWSTVRWLPEVVRQTTNRHRPRHRLFQINNAPSTILNVPPKIADGLHHDDGPLLVQPERLCLGGFVARQVKRLDATVT